jgi:hypothetical protein
VNPQPVISRSTKPTWRMTEKELAKVVAEHFGFTVRGPWIRDDRGVPIAIGWEHLAKKLSKRKFIVQGQGINWRLIGPHLHLPRATRTTSGSWI